MAPHDAGRPLTPAHLPPSVRAPSLQVGPIASGVAVAVALVAGLAWGLITASASRPRTDACALPPGLDLAALAASDRSWIARRTIACMDLAAGRIDPATYRATVAALDHPAPDAALAAPPPMVWAARVVGFSTQWSDSDWSAERALGAPDVHPAGTDNAQAWASRGADDRPEWIEVALAQPTRLANLQILESYNPGAVSQVEVITVDGFRRTVFRGPAAALGTPDHARMISLACADAPVAAIRVTLDSPAVAGWNELDAIGGQACE